MSPNKPSSLTGISSDQVITSPARLTYRIPGGTRFSHCTTPVLHTLLTLAVSLSHGSDKMRQWRLLRPTGVHVRFVGNQDHLRVWAGQAADRKRTRLNS